MIGIAIGIVHIGVAEGAVSVKSVFQIKEGVFALLVLGAAAADDVSSVHGLVKIAFGRTRLVS